MSVRFTTSRLGITAAAGALAFLTCTGAAVAADNDTLPAAPSASDLQAAAERAAGQEATPGLAEESRADARHRYYKGRVIARTGLLLRDAPTRSSDVVRSEPYGAIVHIYCKTTGDNVDGNNRWYLLTDGTWAWGSARYIENIGAAPRFC